MDHRDEQRDDEGVEVPTEEVRLLEEVHVVDAPVLRDDIADDATAAREVIAREPRRFGVIEPVDVEGLQDDADEGNEPDEGDEDQDDVDRRVPDDLPSPQAPLVLLLG